MVFHGTRRTTAFNAAEWTIHQVLSSHFIICDVLSTHALLIQRLEDNCLRNVLSLFKPQRRIYHAYFEAPNPQRFVLRDRRVLGSHSSIETESFIDLNDAHDPTSSRHNSCDTHLNNKFLSRSISNKSLSRSISSKLLSRSISNKSFGRSISYFPTLSARIPNIFSIKY